MICLQPTINCLRHQEELLSTGPAVETTLIIRQQRHRLPSHQLQLLGRNYSKVGRLHRFV